ncbi:MAG: Asp-tRNA(Asn)/Glu-tRNA(Gln) amidotransferase GatCAB subunit A, partial [Betaproteobacteria bacterium]|nr:Asp-tRNA(Asn)/Glu-tRNA(Gln) amidotransferase GatCAB subunit A [Betaproteobacteria bacterium]
MSSYSDLVFLSAARQAKLIRQRAISPCDLVQACLDRIERYDPVLRAYITVCAEPALAAARQAEREIAAGDDRGPLHGVPFGVKDQLCTRGIRTTVGSKIMADHIPDFDATVIARLKAA